MNERHIKEEGLRDWFGKSKSKDGKKGWVNVVTGDSCASDKPGEGIPKCVSSAKRASMSKKERRAAAAAKRREDPGQQSKSGASKPTMVKTDRKTRKEEKFVPPYEELKTVAKEKEKKKSRMNAEEAAIVEAKDKKGKGSGTKDACYHKVKSRYSVWPSAYASGALVKCRKVGAANWGNSTKKEETEINPISFQQFQEKCWKGYEKKGMKTMFGKRYPNCVKKEEVEGIDEGKYSSSVRATYGGKTETFPKEIYKKKAKKVEVKEGEIDEALTGERRQAMAKKINTAKSGSDRATAFNLATRNDMGSSYQKKSTGGKGSRFPGYGDRGAGNKAARRMGKEPMRQGPEKEVSEETLKATGLFSDQEINAMLEAMSSYDRNRKRAAQRAADRNAARAAGKTGVVPGVGYVSPRKEKETYVDSAGTTRHKSGAKMP